MTGICEIAVSRIKDTSKRAIYNVGSYGPLFGTSSDLGIGDNCNASDSNYCGKGNYEYALPDSGCFTVDDYEVFQIQ